MLFLEHFGITHAGRVRENNEDSLLVGEGRDDALFAVADGIGGFEAGEVASSITIDVLKELEPGAPFDAAVQEANRRILAASRNDERLSGMGTTVVAARFTGSRTKPAAEIAHVGDSRAYLLRGNDLRPLTEDHSLVAELVRSGDLTRDQASNHPQKNLITRALGAEEAVEVDTMVIPVETGDRLLLCSDGLSDMVPDEEIRSTLTADLDDPEKPAKRLLSAALEAGGQDNVTIVVVDVKDREPDGEPRETREASVAPTLESGDGSATRRTERRRPTRRPGGVRGKPRAGRFKKAGMLLRALALVIVVVVALTPAYLWGSSRYFLDIDGGEIVAYRGLPYAPLGVELNEEWRRTNLKESEIKGPYRAQLENNKLYSRSQVEDVLRDLRS